MPCEIVLAPEAVEDLQALKANLRATVRDALETHLRHEPTKTSRSRGSGGKRQLFHGIAPGAALASCSGSGSDRIR